MKKLLFAAFVLLLLCFPLCAKAATEAESVAEEAGIGALENEFVSGDELRGAKSVNVFEKLWEILKLSFTQAGGFAAGFARVIAVLIFCGLVSALGNGAGAEKPWSWFSLLLLSAVAEHGETELSRALVPRIADVPRMIESLAAGMTAAARFSSDVT